MPIRMKLRHMRKWQRIATTSSSPVLYTKPCLMRRLNKQPKMKKHTSCGDDQHKPVGNISWLCTWRSRSNRVVVICKDILTVSQDAEVILLGNHIVTPDSLYQRAISIAHESHQGPVKTKKKLLHEKKWFPKIDHDVREMINHPDPLQMSLLPPEPMAHCPHGHLWSIPDRRIFVCIVIDDYSQHPEV